MGNAESRGEIEGSLHSAHMISGPAVDSTQVSKTRVSQSLHLSAIRENGWLSVS